MKVEKRIALVAATLLPLGGTTHAQDESPWLLRFGVTTVSPKSNNSEIVSVDDGTQFTVNATYFFKPNWGVEVLAALPFEHDLSLADGTPIGNAEHLPPTFSVQYHFKPDGKIRPYVGLGLNYTTFTSERLAGPLAGGELDLDDSVGLAVQVGVDFPISDRWLINLDARAIDIETDAALNGAFLTKVAIDPSTFGVSAGYRF